MAPSGVSGETAVIWFEPKSAAVKTPATPGISLAVDASISPRRAWAKGERTMAAQSAPSTRMSSR